MLREALPHADGDAKLQAELHSDLAWTVWFVDGEVDAAMHHALANRARPRARSGTLTVEIARAELDGR